MIRALASLLLAFMLLPTAVLAAERHMQVALVAETGTPRPGGEVAIAVTMSPAAGWHGYWLNTGDAGTPDRIAWELPKGASLSPLSYPVPKRLVVAGLMNYVYPRPYALLGRLRIPPGLAPGAPLHLAATIDYLVCSDTLCVPEKADIALDLTIGDGKIDPATRVRFDTWHAALPRPLGAASRFALHGDSRLALAVPLAGVEQVRSAYFYPAQHGVIEYATPQKTGIAGDQLIVELARRAESESPAQVAGVLRLERNDGSVIGLSIEATPGKVPAASRWLTSSEAPFAFAPFLLMLLAAIAGGLILNAMPCVFPILSLKALSLARSGESDRAARAEALAYGGGVILTCIALGGLILILRAGGESVGWAFQLQNPHITLVLLLLMTAVGLNLAGLFELPGLSYSSKTSAAGKPSGAFLTGILAAFVATPCTGPFMGAALGSALILPPLAALGIFAGLGIGLALPFILLAYIPGLRSRLPRPGAWMEKFRHILAVPMLMTALGLGWVLWRQTGVTGLATGFPGAALLMLALWWLGQRQHRGRTAGLAAIALFAAIAAPLLFSVLLSTREASAPASTGDTPFSETHLAELRQQGGQVFVYFTADWCLTCKVNEQVAIDREAVRKSFARKGITVLAGDWTNGDPAISRFLESQGRSGVPLYLFYPKNGGPPQVLPQILTVNLLTALGE